MALLAQLKQWLGLFVPNLSQSQDTQHLTYNDLPEQTQLDATYLRKVRQRLEAGAKLAAEETSRTNELIKRFMERSTQTQQHVIAQIRANFASYNDRQKRTEEAIESEGAVSWSREREWAQEIVRSKGQLDTHERLINVLGTELVNQRVAREESHRQLAEMKTMLESLLNQVKGKGKQTEPTLERSIAEGGRGNGGNRPPPPQQAALGPPGGGESDNENDDEDGRSKGRRDERPTRKGNEPEENEEEEEANWDQLRFSRALGKAIGDTTKRPAQPPREYEQAKHQDVRFWLIACKDFFDRNPYQWQDEADRIRYALSSLKGPQVSAVAMTYRNQMTGELGYTKQGGYELWDIFTKQLVHRFGLTHEEEKALWQMMKVRYKGDIDQFLREIDNWNVKVKVTRVVLRK